MTTSQLRAEIKRQSRVQELEAALQHLNEIVVEKCDDARTVWARVQELEKELAAARAEVERLTIKRENDKLDRDDAISAACDAEREARTAESKVAALREALTFVQPPYRVGMCWCSENRNVNKIGHGSACMNAQKAYDESALKQSTTGQQP